MHVAVELHRANLANKGLSVHNSAETFSFLLLRIINHHYFITAISQIYQLFHDHELCSKLPAKPAYTHFNNPALKMCYALYNRCRNQACAAGKGGKEAKDAKAVEPLPMPLQLCDKASRSRPCKSPGRIYVAGEANRQLCTACNGGTPLQPVEHHAPRINSEAATSRKNSSTGDRGLKPNAAKHYTNTTTLNTDIGAIPALLASLSSISISGINDVPDPNRLTHKSHLKSCLQPIEQLPEEPKQWEEWRDTEPAKEDIMRDSREQRYQKALRDHTKRVWPLPYESFQRYLIRQIQSIGRQRIDYARMESEYCNWRFDEPLLFASDDSHFQGKIRDAFDRYMRDEATQARRS